MYELAFVTLQNRHFSSRSALISKFRQLLTPTGTRGESQYKSECSPTTCLTLIYRFYVVPRVFVVYKENPPDCSKILSPRY